MVILDVQAATSKAEAPGHLSVAVGGRQVERVLTRVVGHVHHTPEGAQGLGQTEETLSRVKVYGQDSDLQSLLFCHIDFG